MNDAWDVAQANQQPSASYVARVIAIESDETIHEYPPVQATEMRYAGVGR